MIRIQNSEFRIKNLGFTLIELLVVISIIGILASIAMVSYSGTQKQTRDTQRKSDLNQYRNALQTFASANDGNYPGGSGESQNNESIFTVGGTLIPDFMSSKIPDPLEGQDSCDAQTCTYIYQSTALVPALALEFVLYARLETGGAWEVCSNGKSGKADSYTVNATCDL